MARITIEDSLKEGQNRFALALLTIRRVKQLLRGSKALSEKQDNREVVTALREIAEGKVRYAHLEPFSSDDSDTKETKINMEIDEHEQIR